MKKAAPGLFGALLMLLAVEANAAGVCFEPRAPSIGYISKPNRPFCGSNCDDREIESYKQDVEGYFAQLRQYVADLAQFNKKAKEYIECMAQL